MEKLITKINEGMYQEHQKLPSERELCVIYNVSRITVRQALEMLEREGYIKRIHGKGTFVSAKSINQKLVKLYSFTEEMKNIGKTPKTEVVSFSEIAIEKHLAEKMNLYLGDEVFQVIRLRFADDEPLMYETTYLPKKYFPDLTKEKLIKRSMYDIFREDYQITVTKAIEQFTSSLIKKEVAAHLLIESNQPAMVIKRLAFHNEKLIEYTVNVVRGNKFEYTVELQ
jgi:GntR family transcriptional regulator